MLFVNLCIFALLGTIFLTHGIQNDTIYSTYVTFDTVTQTFDIRDTEPTNNSFVAVAHIINTTANQTGWTYLELTTLDHGGSNDSVQAYAAGLAEGHLTRQLIDLHWQNLLRDYCDEPYNQYCLRLRDFLATNLAWVRQQIATHQGDPYWHQVAMFYTQLKGISDGYHDTIGSISMDTDPLGIYLLQIYYDLGQLEQVLRVDDIDDDWNSDHCSALVKLMPHNDNLYTAHNTWSSYNTMLRVLKKYSLRYHRQTNSDSDMPAGSLMTFSSYPGVLTSLDDFHVLSSKMVTMETTIPIYNDHLHRFIAPKGIVMEPVRAWTANRLADSGRDWVRTFVRYNSGTYNNEWMVIDYKLFEPGSKDLQPGLLTVIEQLPGHVTYADVTDVLQKKGYWASYNVPYFPDIYNMSGYPAKFSEFGDHFSHDNCPRAKIFKRDQSKITDRKSLYKLMRYNDYVNDPLSRCNCTPSHNADYAIAARNDLNPDDGTYPIQILEHMMFGATDLKMTSYATIDTLQMEAVSSPTYDQLPPFQWSKQSKEDNKRHFGHPDLFKFKPVYFNGVSPSPYRVE